MKQRPLLALQLLSFTLMGGMGAFVNFINLYLEQELGLTGSQIGFITMMSMGLTIIINPILGYIGDKTGQHVTMLKIAFFLSTCLVYLYSRSTTFGVVLLVAIFFEISRACIAPFFDLITSDYCARINFDLGKVRVFSSIGFMLTVMTVGFLIAGMELSWLGIGFDGLVDIRTAVFGAVILFLSLSFILMFFVPKPEVIKDKKDEKGRFNREDVWALLKNRKFRFILVFIILSLVAVESAKSFIGNHLVVGLGSAENIVSIMTFLMVFPEFALLPLGSRIIRKFGFKKWYIFSISTMILRMAVYSMTSSVAIFSIIGMVHGIGVTTHVSGNITYIRRVVKPEVLGLAFTIMVSVIAISRAILSFIYGLLYEHFDGFTVFRVATALLVVGLLWTINSKSLASMSPRDI